MVEKAVLEDLEEILALQKLAYLSEAQIYNDYSIAPLTQTLEEIRQDFENQVILKEVMDGKIVGSIRACEAKGVCNIGRVIVHPAYQNRGIGKLLMKAIEMHFNKCKTFSLFTGCKSMKNLSFYASLGYRKTREQKMNDVLTLVYLEKDNTRSE